MHDTNGPATAPRADVDEAVVTRTDAAGESRRARALIASGRHAEARRTARAALKTLGPAPELALVLALAHVAENDDDHDDRAEEVYRDALADFPEDVDLLAGYAELCLLTIHADRPARSGRGPALAARLSELAPGSVQARRVAAVAAAPHRLPAPLSVRTVQWLDVRDALAAGGDPRAAAEGARARAARLPDDRRRAVLAESLSELARPGAAFLVPLARSPHGALLLQSVLSALVLLAAAGFGLPVWAAACGVLLTWTPRILLDRRLRAARRRGGAAAAAHPSATGPGLPDLPPLPPSPRDVVLRVAAGGVALAVLAGSGAWQ
ncbi:hypothetical protein [Streptomyces sp. NPDC086023]|uniref:hypothetical protein n=1 Tax=Streptomyces sp. NPDC086023 TaxID=3365746 RepID=UPI0037D777BA